MKSRNSKTTSSHESRIWYTTHRSYPPYPFCWWKTIRKTKKLPARSDKPCRIMGWDQRKKYSVVKIGRGEQKSLFSSVYCPIAGSFGRKLEKEMYSTAWPVDTKNLSSGQMKGRSSKDFDNVQAFHSVIFMTFHILVPVNVFFCIPFITFLSFNIRLSLYLEPLLVPSVLLFSFFVFFYQ